MSDDLVLRICGLLGLACIAIGLCAPLIFMWWEAGRRPKRSSRDDPLMRLNGEQLAELMALAPPGSRPLRDDESCPRCGSFDCECRRDIIIIERRAT